MKKDLETKCNLAPGVKESVGQGVPTCAEKNSDFKADRDNVEVSSLCEGPSTSCDIDKVNLVRSVGLLPTISVDTQNACRTVTTTEVSNKSYLVTSSSVASTFASCPVISRVVVSAANSSGSSSSCVVSYASGTVNPALCTIQPNSTSDIVNSILITDNRSTEISQETNRCLENHALHSLESKQFKEVASSYANDLNLFSVAVPDLVMLSHSYPPASGRISGPAVPATLDLLRASTGEDGLIGHEAKGRISATGGEEGVYSDAASQYLVWFTMFVYFTLNFTILKIKYTLAYCLWTI